MLIFIQWQAYIITVDFNQLVTEMFRTSFQTLEVHCKVQNFIMKFTNQFAKLAFDWLLSNVQPITNFVYKPVCQFHCKFLNFATSQRSSEHFSEFSTSTEDDLEELSSFPLHVRICSTFATKHKVEKCLNNLNITRADNCMSFLEQLSVIHAFSLGEIHVCAGNLLI